MHKISKVFRSDSDPNGLLVCNRLLSATHTEHALERNQLVLVVNKANGRKVHLAVRGLDKLKQNEVKVDYVSVGVRSLGYVYNEKKPRLSCSIHVAIW